MPYHPTTTFLLLSLSCIIFQYLSKAEHVQRLPEHTKTVITGLLVESGEEM
jgi:hypothetical protein